MEAVSQESNNMMKKQQNMLKLILEAAKQGDSKIDETLKTYKQEASLPLMSLRFLDSTEYEMRSLFLLHACF